MAVLNWAASFVAGCRAGEWYQFQKDWVVIPVGLPTQEEQCGISIQSTVSCSLYDVAVYSIYMWNLDRKRHTNYCVSHEVLLDGSLLDSDPKKSGLGRQKNFLLAFGWMFPEWFNSNEVKWHPQRIKKPIWISTFKSGLFQFLFGCLARHS